MSALGPFLLVWTISLVAASGIYAAHPSSFLRETLPYSIARSRTNRRLPGARQKFCKKLRTLRAAEPKQDSNGSETSPLDLRSLQQTVQSRICLSPRDLKAWEGTSASKKGLPRSARRLRHNTTKPPPPKPHETTSRKRSGAINARSAVGSHDLPYKANSGPHLDRSGPHLDRIWTAFGPHLDCAWTSFGPLFGFGPHLDRFWTAFGPPQNSFESGSKPVRKWFGASRGKLHPAAFCSSLTSHLFGGAGGQPWRTVCSAL